MSEAPMTLKQIRVGLKSGQEADRSRAILELLKMDTEREAYRVALTILPDLTMDTWLDWVKTAQEGIMNKQDLLGDTVLRRSDEGQLYLMNRKVGGWGARAIPIESERWLLDHYNVRLGEWERDDHGPCCPVIRVAREEQVTHHDFSQRGAMEHSVMAPLLREGMTEEGALKALMGGHVRSQVFVTDGYKADHTKPFPASQLGSNGSMVFVVGGSLTLGGGDKEAVAVKVRLDSGPFPEGTLTTVMLDGQVVSEKAFSEIRDQVSQALGKALYEEGTLEDQCYCGSPLSKGMEEFISSHPGVRVCLGSDGVYVALMPDGIVMSVSKDGVIKEDSSTLVEGTDWDAISDALGPDDD